MNVSEFENHFKDAPSYLRLRLLDFVKYPTERNGCYITGYIAGISDAGCITYSAATYWLCFVSAVEQYPTIADIFKQLWSQDHVHN